MSGVPIIGKVYKKIMDTPLLKVAVIGAAIWFTAGTASAYYAAPELGLGAAMSTSWTGMVSAFTGAAAAEGAAAQTAELAAASSSASAGAATAEVAAAGTATGATAGVTQAEMLAAQTAGFGAEGAALTAEAAAGAEVAGGGVSGWMSANPLQTMMLGQAGVGAYQGHLADKAAKREEKRIEEERQSRGTMGFDYLGKPGIVASQQGTMPSEPSVPASAAPVVASQQVRTPIVGRQQVAVQRENLPKLNQQGQLA